MNPPFSFLGRGKLGRALSSALNVPCLPHTATPKGWVVLSVPDHAIEAEAKRFPGRAVHMSGSLHVEGVPCAHPLMSFDGEPRDWTGTPLALTGEVPNALVEAMEGRGFVPFALPAEHKALYHAAAVLSCGHAATLWLGAMKLLADAGVQLPGDGMLPIARATLDNVAAHGLGGRTGPFVRGDRGTIERDAAALPAPWRDIFLTLGAAPVGEP